MILIDTSDLDETGSSMARIDEAAVLRHWDLHSPVDIEPLRRGANNRSYLVTSGGNTYVLKRYRNSGITERLWFEHALLLALADADLPFAIPSPLATRSGTTLVDIAPDRDGQHLALFHRIPGRSARFGDEPEAFRCGAALARLDHALAAVPIPSSISIPEAYGDLKSIHERVPDPDSAIRGLEGGGALADVVRVTEARWIHATSGGTSQIIHGDFYPSNTMVEHGQVSGILDFEFSGRGYRAMDFVIGMAAFSTNDWEAGCAWPVLESFAAGYLQQAPLTDEEIEALPDLLRMRELTSLIHWIGRLREGLTTPDDVQDRLRRLTALHRWLETDQSRLLSRIGQINRV